MVDGVVAGNQISNFNPSYQIRSNGDGTGDIEFEFCDGDIEFQFDDEFSFGDYSFSSASPLLPHNHFYSNLSPASRTRAIEQGRKELMEMIRNMPESTYELSLKDLVDYQLDPEPEPRPQPQVQPQPQEADQEKYVWEDQKRFCVETEEEEEEAALETEKKQKKKKREAGPSICRSRSVSMDANSLRIKMFFPSSLTLSFNKKSGAENSSKVSPTPPSEPSQKPPPHSHKLSWIQRVFFNKNIPKNRQEQHSTNIRTKSRNANPSSLPACWPFFLSKKSKDKRRGDFGI